MAEQHPATPAPGWYADPERPRTMRYWDGFVWTDQRAPQVSISRKTVGIVLWVLAAIAGVNAVTAVLHAGDNGPKEVAWVVAAIVLGLANLLFWGGHRLRGTSFHGIGKPRPTFTDRSPVAPLERAIPPADDPPFDPNAGVPPHVQARRQRGS